VSISGKTVGSFFLPKEAIELKTRMTKKKGAKIFLTVMMPM